MNTKVELLAPAGNLEKLKVALEFGADAVYFGLPNFSLRARINHFDKAALSEGAKICRQKGKKFYLTFNIYAHNEHLKQLPAYYELIKELQPDGLIVSDPGLIRLLKEKLPNFTLHLSTQANATNTQAVKFWQEQGIKRVILARELMLEEIAEIKKDVPEVELECFVHGAMCMAYSGRCVLSKWMAGRSANLGDCAQPCRWRYHVKTDAKDNKINRNAQELTITDDLNRFDIRVEEDEQGTYLFNSYDMCLLEHLPKLLEAGVDSLKIEGRAKSVYYLAVVTRAYRKVLDLIARGENRQVIESEMQTQMKELEKISHRGYSQGFLLGNEPNHLFEKDAQETDWMFCGLSLDSTSGNSVLVKVHNSVFVGDEVELITPRENRKLKVRKIVDAAGQTLKSAHGGGAEPFEIEFDQPVSAPFLLRRMTEKSF